MSWFNPWGEAADLRRELLSINHAYSCSQDRERRLRLDLNAARDAIAERDGMLRTAQNRIAYLEARLSQAVFRDKKTGRLLPKGKVTL